MRKVFSIVMVMLSLVMRGQTLEECQQAAAENYPQIKRYALISRQTKESVRNIGKSWLPQLSAMAQATWQSDVVTLPEAMGNMLTNWQWIRNANGLRYCYYFNPVSNGSLGAAQLGGTTPDGWQVNSAAAWTVEGVAQTK